MNRRWLTLTLLTAAPVLLASAQENSGPTTDFHGDLVSVQMIDTRVGWAAGKSGNAASLLKTDDGGQSWRDISPLPVRGKKPLLSTDADEAIYYSLLDAGRGWAVLTPYTDTPGRPSRILFSTDDGGRTWQRGSFQTEIGDITDIQFVDRTHGFMLVGSDPALGSAWKATFRTDDGGKTWQTTSETSSQRKTEGALPHLGFAGTLVFRNASDGWVTGSPRGDQEAFFLRTRDGGTTWQPVPLPPPPGFFRGYASVSDPKFFGAAKTDGTLQVHFIQHDPERSENVSYQTRDGGDHWTKTGSIPTDWQKDEEAFQIFFDLQHGLMLIGARLATTDNGGATWQPVETNLRLGDKESLSSVQFVDPMHGWILKDILRNDNEYELLQTVDGGHTWTHRYGAQP